MDPPLKGNPFTFSACGEVIYRRKLFFKAKY